MLQEIRLSTVAILASLTITGCDSQASESDLVWAVNVGGAAYEGADGTRYDADVSIEGGSVGHLETVKGSQDAFLYQSYREGDIEVAHPISNGVHDVTFHFVEPEEFERGDRVFDAFVEGKPAIRDLDVMLARDGKVNSALTVTVPNVQIVDGELNIHFQASSGEPLLSGLIVRNKNRSRRAWKLVWSDEFDDAGPPDPGKWNIDEWPARVVNDEDQAYTGRDRNLRVVDGHLIIEAFKEKFDNAEYTSARVHSRGKGDFLYGRFEVRAKLPAGKGTWPAIWMLPSDPFKYATTCEPGEEWQGSSTCDAWPNSGEIDIMEHVGYEMNHVHGTVHNQAYYWAKWEQRKGRILVDDVAGLFHTYVLEWSPEEIRTFVDDSLYFTYVNEKAGWESWPFDQPFHLILNVAVGGMWGRSGGGIDDAALPQQMVVDYVRVYEAEPENR